MTTILLASRNTGKVREFHQLLHVPDVRIVSLQSIGYTGQVKETGKTYEENACLKARIYGSATGMMTIADDSGLEIDALGGRPGILSARYAPGSDKDRIDRILLEMKNVPDEKRKAVYRIAIALYHPADQSIHTFHGECKGLILREPRGTGGFGYDPIFYNYDLKKSNAEATFEEKNKTSHRAHAVSLLLDYLASRNIQ